MGNLMESGSRSKASRKGKVAPRGNLQEQMVWKMRAIDIIMRR